MFPSIPAEALDAAVRAALTEDVSDGDITTQAVIPADVRANATIVSREDCVLAGLPLARRVFELLDPSCEFQNVKNDGDRVQAGEVVFMICGGARALLTGERTALNFVQRLSGVATATRRHVDRSGDRVAVLDTRKTTPGLRALERYAVAVGGGRNHRFGLFDQVLLKENHFSLSGLSYRATVDLARRSTKPGVVLGAEARNYSEAEAAIEGGADYVLLDNYTPAVLGGEVERLRERAKILNRHVEFEASGGICETNISEFARAGVERISCGGLTHSARAIDFALDVEAQSLHGARS